VSGKEKWNRIYSKVDRTQPPEPSYVLSSYHYLLPQSGRAVDIACGLGGNTIYLANVGLHTTAIDISDVAIEIVANYQHPLIETSVEAITEAGLLSKQPCDVIVVSRYLDRDICSAIVESLKPGGLIFYQTFVAEKCDQTSGPGNPDYLLKSNELLSLATELDSNYSAAWKLLGRCYVEAGDIEKAVMTYEKGIVIAGENGDKQAAKEMNVFLKRARKKLDVDT